MECSLRLKRSLPGENIGWVVRNEQDLAIVANFKRDVTGIVKRQGVVGRQFDGDGVRPGLQILQIKLERNDHALPGLHDDMLAEGLFPTIDPAEEFGVAIAANRPHGGSQRQTIAGSEDL